MRLAERALMAGAHSVGPWSVLASVSAFLVVPDSTELLPSVSRRNGPASRKMPRSPIIDPAIGRREGSAALESMFKTCAAHACDARATFGSRSKLAWVAWGITKYLSVASAFPETKACAVSRTLRGAHEPLSTKVLAGGGGGSSKISIVACIP